MKLSVSLIQRTSHCSTVRTESGLPSRSAALRHAISLLRHSGLEQDYEAAWAQWEASGEQTIWGAAIGDGLGDAPR